MSLRFLLVVALTSCIVYGQTQSVPFNQVLNINGDLSLNSFQFPDGSKIETFSQSQRQLIVNQNTQPLSANQVTGSTGGPFVALQQSSIIVQTNNATDLVGAQMELSMNMQIIQQMNVNPDNTFVAKLSTDRQSWQIQEAIRSVNRTDATVRMVKMNTIDGEYQILGRQTNEVNNALVPFGTSGNSVVQVQGSGISEMEFIDGFRMSVRSSQPMTVTAVVKNGVSTSMLAGTGAGTNSLNNFRYLVTTNLAGVQPALNQMVSVVQLPLNAIRLQSLAQQMGATSASSMFLSIAQRPVQANPGGATGQLSSVSTSNTNGNKVKRQNSTMSTSTSTSISNNPAATQLLLSPTFTPVAQAAVFDMLNSRIAVPVTQIDGEFIITVAMASGQTSAQSATGQTGTTGQTGATGANPATGTSNATASGAAGTVPAAQAASAVAATPDILVSPVPVAAAASSVVAVAPATAATLAGAAPVKRQASTLVEPTAQQVGSGVVIPMSQIDQMAQIQSQGSVILVGTLMDSFMNQIAGPQSLATTASNDLTGLVTDAVPAAAAGLANISGTAGVPSSGITAESITAGSVISNGGVPLSPIRRGLHERRLAKV